VLGDQGLLILGWIQPVPVPPQHTIESC
jgi:hypothetical protein